MLAVALKCPFAGVKMSAPMVVQMVKNDMLVIIHHVLIKHFMQNTAITAVNLMKSLLFGLGRGDIRILINCWNCLNH